MAEVRARESGGAEVGYRRTRVSTSRCGDLDKRQDSSAMIKDHYCRGEETRLKSENKEGNLMQLMQLIFMLEILQDVHSPFILHIRKNCSAI